MVKRSVARVYEDVAQHLTHGGFCDRDGARMLGVTPGVFRELVASAERRRPRRCAVRCTDVLGPCCPYCDHALEVAHGVKAEECV